VNFIARKFKIETLFPWGQVVDVPPVEVRGDVGSRVEARDLMGKPRDLIG